MRRLLAWLLVVALLVPLAACVPSGYEGKNPNRPEDMQIGVDELQQENGETQAPAQEEQTNGSSEESGE
jgi:hypothetical protein